MDRKLKIWEMALLFGILCAIMGGMWLDREQTQLANQVIRLHVIANSDSDGDQALKLKVRDGVLAQAEQLYPEGASPHRRWSATWLCWPPPGRRWWSRRGPATRSGRS